MCPFGRNPGNSHSSRTSTTAGCRACGVTSSGGARVAGDGVVDVSTGVTLNGSSKDWIQIRTRCTSEPRVIQFIHRETLLGGVRQSGTTHSSSGSYPLTTDPANPAWHTDANPNAVPKKPDYPGTRCICPGEYTIWDRPALAPGTGETRNATCATFLFCDGNILRRVDWTRTRTSGGAASYRNVSISNASALPQWAIHQLSSDGYPFP